MISVEEARARILGAIRSLPTEVVGNKGRSIPKSRSFSRLISVFSYDFENALCAAASSFSLPKARSRGRNSRPQERVR